MTCIFWPKPPPVSGHDDPHARLGQPEGAGHPGAEDVGHLGPGPEGEPVVLPPRDQPPALERRGRAARVGEGLAQDHRRGREGAVDVAPAVALPEQHVGWPLRMQARRVRRRRGRHVRHRGQRLVVDLDGRGAVHRRVGALRRDHGHRLADEARPLGRRARATRWARSRARRAAGRAAPPRPSRSRPVSTRTTPGDSPRGLRLHRADDGVRVGAADEGRVQQPGKRDVVEEAPLPGQETGVLEALDVGAQVAGRWRRAHSPVTAWPRAAAPRSPAARAAPRSSRAD